jgi:SAM-dependent methyltransferase
MHLTRYSMYKSLTDALPQPLKGNILGVSHIKNFQPLIDMNNSRITITDYPAVNMQALPFRESTFDVVISDQVIEHLENSQRAIDESRRVLKVGGIAIHTTCFINYIHPDPKDFYRYTPAALSYLCREFSEVVQCGSWGNRLAISLCFLSDRFRFMSIPDSKYSVRNWLASRNEKAYPIVTWIVARK